MMMKYDVRSSPYLVFLHDFFCEPVSKNNSIKTWSRRYCPFYFWGVFLGVFYSKFHPPEIHDVVFMVASVQVHVVRVKEKVGKQEYYHFNWHFPTIHKIAIKHVRCLRRGKPILNSRHMSTAYPKSLEWLFLLWLMLTVSNAKADALCLHEIFYSIKSVNDVKKNVKKKI